MLTNTIRFASLALCLAAVAAPAQANCRINSLTASPAVNRVFKANGGYEFKNYDTLCAKLQKANAQIVLVGSSGVLANRSYAWISIGVGDGANGNIMTNDFATSRTTMNEYASSDKADAVLWETINVALNEWNVDPAIAALQKVRKTVKPAGR
ncbi:hypothetical protein GCM10008164_41120 [Achromobacter xylosoxidans]|nr:hypothetical protein GCM10008164_41120 [Achromobacter xylosoxidans]